MDDQHISERTLLILAVVGTAAATYLGHFVRRPLDEPLTESYASGYRDAEYAVLGFYFALGAFVLLEVLALYDQAWSVLFGGVPASKLGDYLFGFGLAAVIVYFGANLVLALTRRGRSWVESDHPESEVQHR